MTTLILVLVSMVSIASLVASVLVFLSVRETSNQLRRQADAAIKDLDKSPLHHD